MGKKKKIGVEGDEEEKRSRQTRGPGVDESVVRSGESQLAACGAVSAVLPCMRVWILFVRVQSIARPTVKLMEKSLVQLLYKSTRGSDH